MKFSWTNQFCFIYCCLAFSVCCLVTLGLFWRFSLSFCSFSRRSLYYLFLRRCWSFVVLLNLSGASVIEHDSRPARWSRIRHRLGSCYGLGTTIVDAHGLITTNGRFATTISIRALGLQGNEVGGALILRGILVRHPRLHDLFQALALSS